MSETIFRIQKNADNPFVMIDKRIFTDKKLSYRAKGVLGYLLSRPDNWLVNMVDVANQSTEGRDAVITAVNELMKHGYVERIEHRDKGRFSHYEYLVYEVPKSVVPSDDTAHWKSVNGKPVNGLSVSGKSATTNKDITKNEYKENKKEIFFEIHNLKATIEQIQSHFVRAGVLVKFDETLNIEVLRQELYQFNLNYHHVDLPPNKVWSNLVAWFKRKSHKDLARFNAVSHDEQLAPSHVVAPVIQEPIQQLSREERLAKIAQIEKAMGVNRAT